MKPEEQVALLAADIEDELGNLARLRAEYTELLGRVDLNASDASPYDKAVIGYYLHNFYNGCEAIFRAVAFFFENERETASWHTDLLKRMKLEVPGLRPALIDDELYALLDDFRAFRHRFRHLYGFQLDWEKERLVAARFERVYNLLVEQVRHFLSVLAQIGHDPSS